MPKDLLIDPTIVRRPATVSFAPIEVNIPASAVNTWRSDLGDAALLRLLEHMVAIREFESMLDSFKRTGEYAGVSYDHKGPAHLSIGQEGAAVGQAAALSITDFVFGSHRSHGEVLAKGMAAIAEADEAWLAATMTGYLDGAILQVLADYLGDATPRERARQFLHYGFLAEIFGRRTGFNRGLGGSMHAFFTPFGIYPNNAIVGGSAPIASGAALQRRVSGQPGIVVATIGDASTGCGAVWESLNFAAMSQLRTLWDDRHRGGLPVVFFFANNFYGMGGQTIGETMGYDRLARIGGGVRADSLHAETVDGQNPLAVLAAMRRARGHIENGDGPVLLDVQTYRQSGHSPSDASSYRSDEEMDLWRAADPIELYAAALADAGIPADLDGVRAQQRDLLARVAAIATDLDISPRVGGEEIASSMFSNITIDLDDAPAGETRIPLTESTRLASLDRKSRSGLDADHRPVSKSRAVQLRDGLWEAIAEHAARDGRLVIYGEENRDWDGAFGVYRGLTELLPYHRLFNAPISEATIVGSAVGLAMAGGRALVELMYADFLGRAGDEVFNQLAKWQGMSGGLLRMPVVLRLSVGSKYGAQHSQDWSSLAAHIPGLKVIYPATPYDAKGLMASALSGDDPVIFLESQRLYDQTEVVYPQVPRHYYRVPIGEPHEVRHGADVTIVSGGPTLYRALEAAQRLNDNYDVGCSVFDLRTIVPVDAGPIIESVRETGRLLVVGDACERGSWMHTVATLVQGETFGALDAPVTVVGARNWITPPAELEDLFFPTADRIIDMVHHRLRPLKNYSPALDADSVAESRRAT